jgi:hypothetical protein
MTGGIYGMALPEILRVVSEDRTMSSRTWKKSLREERQRVVDGEEKRKGMTMSPRTPA